MSRPFISASFFPATDVARDGFSLVFYSNDCVDIRRLRFVSLNAGFVENFLKYCFVSVRSLCASEFLENINLSILFAGNISYLNCFKFFHFLEY